MTNKITVIYFDTFAQEYLLKKDINAAPERYLELRKGINEGIWIDYYSCRNGERINFAYNKLTHWKDNYNLWYANLKNHLEKNNVDINSIQLIAREYPPSDFKYFIKQI